MPASEKTLSLIGKLMRLASESGNASDGEKNIAAREVVRLIEEHGIDLGAPPEHHRKESPNKVARSVWSLSIALQYCSCSHCGNMISRADVVWVRVLEGNRVQYRHNAGTCKVA